jgi:hypothetical protein
MTVYGKVEIWLHSFFTSELVEGGRFIPGENAHVPAE